VEEIKDPKRMQEIADSLRKKGLIGFVPTMGALHKGHLSLIEKAREENDFVVVSIFVNPLQFGRGEDYDRYQRSYKDDYALCKSCGVDYLFYPDVERLYPKKTKTFVRMPSLENVLCGKKRKGHFRGVLTVVAKLFNIVKPHNAYFGEKDFQQAVMIKNMVYDLNFDIGIKTLPTIREKDGLAISSRNSYLAPIERKKAPIIYRTLKEGKKLIEGGKDPSYVIDKMKKMIEKKGFLIEYIEIVDQETLKKFKKEKSLIAVSVHMGKTRLIDNIKLMG